MKPKIVCDVCGAKIRKQKRGVHEVEKECPSCKQKKIDTEYEQVVRDPNWQYNENMFGKIKTFRTS